MKRFFSRFSSAGPTSPTKHAQDAPFDRSEERSLSSAATAPLSSSGYSATGRTKALVAQFEEACLAQPVASPFSDTTPATPQHTISTSPTEAPVAHVAPFSSSTRNVSNDTLSPYVKASVPERVPGSSLPDESDQRLKHAALGARSKRNGKRITSGQEEEQRQASAGSHAASSSSHASKTVAFAPSPQKQRSTSPAHVAHLQRLSVSQPLSRTSSSDGDPHIPSSFSRPTAASQARSRTWTRSAASDATHPCASTALHGQREKPPGRAARPPRPTHAATTRALSRRSYSYSSATADIDPLAIGPSSRAAAKHPPSFARRGSMEAPSHRSMSPSVGTDDAMAASGPLQFPSRTSLSMRLGYPGSASSRPTSRRNSVDPMASPGSTPAVVFPPSAGAATGSFGFPTWSEMTHQELVRNLGPRERTRQEVLWEIVASEERYVTELEKAKEIYIDALLHPHTFDPERVLPPVSASAISSPVEQPRSRDWPPNAKSVEMRPSSSNGEATAFEPGSLSSTRGDLPIAARYMSTASIGKADPSESAIEYRQTQQGVGSPYSSQRASLSIPDGVALRSGTFRSQADPSFGLGLGLGTMATRDRSVAAYMNAPTASQPTGKLSKAQKLRGLARKDNGHADPLRLSVPLPPSLREILASMSDGLVEAHGLLSDALKARYEEQWPLVRSLADVFMKYSHILQHYASYVCHLQRAMEELEEAGLMERAFRGKRLKKERLSNTVGLGRTVAALEACAAEQGYAGLSIFVSMPFQRLLKYPLLFQNLLFHTDPSTLEFESTVAMVVEVERLVRSIEDEKVNAEERDKALDCFARIDGITDRQVLRPRTDRVLIEEQALYDVNARRTLSESAPKEGDANTHASDSEGMDSGTESANQSGGWRSSSNQSGLRAALRNKRSYRRLSDFLSSDDVAHTSSKAPTMGSKKDVWLVRFSDVEIKCQRIGVTTLPMVSKAALRTADFADEQEASDFTARSKESRGRLKALRNTTLRAKTRNLYKFLSVVAWRTATARETGVGTSAFVDGLPTSHEVDEEDGADVDDGASVSTAESSSASCTSSSDSHDGVGGQAGSEKYIRSTKLSFTYWGDRIEPGRAITGGHANANAHEQPKTSIGQRSTTQQVDHVSVPPATTHTGTDSASAPIAASSIGSTRSSRQSRRSTLDGAPSTLSKTQGRRGMSGRLSEPLTASSMSSASEPMQNAVARMHARQRNEKFGARLRSSMGNGADGSHVSVNGAGPDSGGTGSAAFRKGSIAAAAVPRAI
ncbi:ROM1/2 protein [Pseudozyma hubeiensis SY62]|uniref:ROM1/2 protein n=1 Tax=Pseudozyma hubeiensis (strain SY62) TaxID=1305764 RepID=R9PKX1_PSEHS|nr:ROM1/2 protein [Pseudozyma hubeiensis SY62]GAC98750.1 ROM1/2 protein [Pseudozyma hubeiensis SY62]